MRSTPAELQQTATASRNPNLDSFEALMVAMDAELQKTRPPAPTPAPAASTAPAPAPAPATDEDMDEDLDAELDGLLVRDDDADQPADYTLIKNFLESYRSQEGAAGPVSSLAGRLDVPLPRSKAS